MTNRADPWRLAIDSIGPYHGTQLLAARERRAVRLDEEQLEAIAAEGRTIGVDTEPPIPRELVFVTPVDCGSSPAGAPFPQMRDWPPAAARPQVEAGG